MTQKDQQIRDDLVTLLNSVNPFDDRESQDIKEAIEWIMSGVVLYRRGDKEADNPKKHMTSFFVPCDLKNKKIFLVDHIKAERLLAPGGHMDQDELPQETVRREIVEELGVPARFYGKDLRPFFVCQIETVGNVVARHLHFDFWYLMDYSEITLKCDNVPALGVEFKTCGWYGFEDILRMPSDEIGPTLKRFVRKIITI